MDYTTQTIAQTRRFESADEAIRHAEQIHQAAKRRHSAARGAQLAAARAAPQLVEALRTVAHVPGLPDIECDRLTPREAWHEALAAAHRKAAAALRAAGLAP